MDTYTEHRKVTRDVLDFRTEPWLPSSDGSGVIPPSHSNLASLGYKESNHIEFASQQALAITNQQLNEIDVNKIGWKRFSSVDLNTIFNSVEAYCSGETINAPINDNGYFKSMQVSIHNTTYVFHVYIDVRTGDAYSRICNNGVWRAWKPIATTDKIDVLWQGAEEINTTSKDFVLTNSILNYDYIEITYGSGSTNIADLNASMGTILIKPESSAFLRTQICTGFKGSTQVTTKSLDDTTLQIRATSLMPNIRKIYGIKKGGQ